MGDENSLAGSLAEKADQVAEVTVTPLVGDDASLETIVRRFQDSMSVEKTHKFWETQPVGQFKDIGDTSLPEGPIEAATPLSEVKQEPYNLPAAYEWTTCDMKSDYVCSEVYNLLKNNYVEDDENMFRFNYSKEFLSWALRPPGYYQSWHIGVRAKVSKKLVAFISGEEEGRPVGYSHMESSRRRASGTLDHSGNLSNQQTSSFNRESMMPSSSMFAQSAGSSGRVAAVSSRDNLLSGEEFQRSHRTGDVSRGGVISRNSPVEAGKRSSSSRRHYESAIKGIDNLQVSSDDKFHHHH
ncbi:hypothetical protein F2Q68_00030193 [Brassica cretica]|uniref:glycylpeptide N-tetradecanoyltransferase n=1 Tax=Brassica cretica TaxID=69181 RepID=A0A8S9GJV3_BRACR|nr:hypothetical protein F2Q68_00030193 [Brassica cretica]